MVEIKRSDLDSQDALAAPGSAEASPDDSKYRLIYSKSKVYVNPTAYARDNIPGFVALVKKASGLWLPHTGCTLANHRHRKQRSQYTCSPGSPSLS